MNDFTEKDMPSKQEALRRILALEKTNLMLKKRIKLLSRAFFSCDCANSLNSSFHINCEVCDICAVCGCFSYDQKYKNCNSHS